MKDLLANTMDCSGVLDKASFEQYWLDFLERDAIKPRDKEEPLINLPKRTCDHCGADIISGPHELTCAIFELYTDTDRLDWLMASQYRHIGKSVRRDGTFWLVYFHSSPDSEEYADYRHAIDDAMERERTRLERKRKREREGEQDA